jgi:hypothetical protein
MVKRTDIETGEGRSVVPGFGHSPSLLKIPGSVMNLVQSIVPGKELIGEGGSTARR